MHPIVKILIGAIMVIVGVFSTVTFFPELVTLAKAGIGPLLVVVGAFLVWLESDELKMRQEKESQGLQQKFEKEQTQQNETQDTEASATQQDVKQAVESEKHTCGECGRSFDTQRGLSIHQAQKHK